MDLHSTLIIAENFISFHSSCSGVISVFRFFYHIRSPLGLKVELAQLGQIAVTGVMSMMVKLNARIHAGRLEKLHEKD